MARIYDVGMKKLDDRIMAMRAAALKAGRPPVPSELQGVEKARVRDALRVVNRTSDDIVDAVFALLDDRRSWFSEKYGDIRFCDGASTAHLACHIGILQRGKTKLDREGRDYWIKPLCDIGAIEPVTLDVTTTKFHPGHLVAKSPNSCYRLAPSFLEILQANDSEWERLMRAWIADDQLRQRLELQARQVGLSKGLVETKHSDLIAASIKYYVPQFLPAYTVLYVDETDGDRISAQEREVLKRAGLQILLEDAMPDVLLWNPEKELLWVIEAVTSDGEVDDHKVKRMKAFVNRNAKKGVGFTTTYNSWKIAAARQGKYKNIASDTYIWILEDPGRQLHII